MSRYGLRHLLIIRDLTKWLGKPVNRGEGIAGHTASDSHVQMQLIHRLEIRNLKKQALPIGKNRRSADRKRIMPDCAVVTRREFRRAVGIAVTVVPTLGKVVGRHSGDAAVKWC